MLEQLSRGEIGGLIAGGAGLHYGLDAVKPTLLEWGRKIPKIGGYLPQDSFTHLKGMIEDQGSTLNHTKEIIKNNKKGLMVVAGLALGKIAYDTVAPYFRRKVVVHHQ